LAAGVIKQFKEAVKQGKMESFFSTEFQIQPYLRSLKEVKGEFEVCIEAPLLLASGGHDTALKGWKAALEWVLHLDPESKKNQENVALKKSHKRWVKGV